MREGRTYWGIKSSTTATGSWIISGRATNSPSSTEAGPSVRQGVTTWRYFDGSNWVEGDISVTCLRAKGSRDGRGHDKINDQH